MRRFYIICILIIILGLGIAACTTASKTPSPVLPPSPTAGVAEPVAIGITPTPTIDTIGDVLLTESPVATGTVNTQGTSVPNIQISPTVEATPLPATSNIPTQNALPVKPSSVSDCTDVAAFVDDISIPDGTLLQPGVDFEKIWRVRNAGTCVWEGYQLVYAGGEPMGGAASMVQTINPDEYANISMRLKAPSRGGKYIGNWMFLTPDGKAFGIGVPNTGTLWVEVNIDYPVTTQAPPQSGAGAGTAPSSPDCGISTNDSYISQLLSLINSERVKNGLASVSLDPKLTAAAQNHSVDMACTGSISHTGSDGSLWYDRVKAQGFANFNSARENIYAGNPDFGGDAGGAFDWWMKSPIHRANILFANVSLIGLGYAYNPNGEITGFYTMVLARP